LRRVTVYDDAEGTLNHSAVQSVRATSSTTTAH
jgi:hypothetical protein